MAKRSHIVLKTAQPLAAKEREDLASAGIDLQEYLGAGRYLAGTEDPEAAGALPFVTEVSPYSWNRKLWPELAVAVEASSPALAAAGEEAENPPRKEKKVRVEVVFHPEIPAADHAEEVAQAAGVDLKALRIGRDKIRLAVTPSRLLAIAALEGVSRVEPYAPARPCANVACGLVQATFTHDRGLRGQGEIVALCDSGLDTGDLASLHPHFARRVHRLVPVGRQTRTNDPHGHGTHCAGLIVGSGQSSEAPGAVTGAAPDARLLVQSVFAQGSPFRGVPTDLRDLFSPAHAEGARVHSNSWGQTALSNRYNKSCEEVDDFVHRHRDFVVVFAVGNEGKSAGGVLVNGTVRPPSLAKNCIAVGACETRRPGKSSPWRTDSTWRTRFAGHTAVLDDGWANNDGGLAPLSGRGPTADGRIRPDLVAPGTSILGPRSSAGPSGQGPWGSSADNSYLYLGGTSSAAALVSGCAAVVRQHLREQFGASPSAALVKAVLINGADDLPGQYTPSEAPATPNFSEGWGRVNLRSAIAPDPPVRVEIFDEDAGLDTDEESTFDFQCVTPGLPLKVTLVWTDPPGEQLQNDLDLIVRSADGTERHGNIPAGSVTFDRVNNVEQVLWEGFPAGLFTVVVHATRLTVPGRRSRSWCAGGCERGLEIRRREGRGNGCPDDELGDLLVGVDSGDSPPHALRDRTEKLLHFPRIRGKRRTVILTSRSADLVRIRDDSAENVSDLHFQPTWCSIRKVEVNWFGRGAGYTNTKTLHAAASNALQQERSFTYGEYNYEKRNAGALREHDDWRQGDQPSG